MAEAAFTADYRLSQATFSQLLTTSPVSYAGTLSLDRDR